jgi:type IV pilus assembly protein PilB
MREGGNLNPPGSPMPSVASGPVRLGDYLVEREVITEEQLESAVRHQNATDGALLGRILVDYGWLSDDGLARALADIAGVPFSELTHDDVDPAAVAAVPRDVPPRLGVMPVRFQDDHLVVACSDPFNILAIDELERRAGVRVAQICSPESDVREAIEAFYGGAGVLEGLVTQAVDKQDAERSLVARGVVVAADTASTAEEPVVRLVDEILNQGVRRRATDIHIEPEEDVVRVRYRVDGMLQSGPMLPTSIRHALISRLKVIAGLDISEQRLPQEGHITYQAPAQEIDLRVACFPTVFGEKVALRILERKTLFRGLGDLGLEGETLAHLHDSILRTKGIVLLTGPTGSGKTTTLYTMLQSIDMLANNIVTLEDPVEYRIPEIRQSQINNRAGFTFATGLRSLLRQDPDVILLGEIRDPETAGLALRAALTGILVLSTLHTNEAAGTFPRLVDMGIEPYLIGSTIISAVAERLVRTVCPHCTEEAKPDEALLERLGLGGESIDGEWRLGAGCRRCGGTGYLGRTGIFEILMVSDAIRDAIKGQSDTLEIRKVAEAEGMQTLMQHGLTRVLRGETTLEELARVARE